MKKIIPVDTSKFMVNIARDYSISTSEIRPGPPETFDGLNVGVATLDRDPPHNGEIHLDGDELLYVISGSVSVTSDSNPGGFMELGAGDGCIIQKGEWHKVHILEKTTLIHITPGPNNKHR